MKRALITFIATVLLIITIMLLCMCLFSCADDIDDTMDSERFTKVEDGRFADGIMYTIYYDNETLIMYMYIKTFYDGRIGIGGITVMFDKDGKPLLYDKDKKRSK